MTVRAVTISGASWDRVGAVLEPAEGERVDIAMSTSTDGLSWNRHGTTLQVTGEGAEAHGVHTPCAVRCHDGSLRMWYAGLGSGDTSLSYRICSARFPGPWSTGV